MKLKALLKKLGNDVLEILVNIMDLIYFWNN